MPTPFYIEFEGQGGPIEGSVQIAGREGMVEGLQFDHAVEIPVDPHTGESTGVRQHGAVKITKAFDKSSPLLYKACTEGELLPSVVLHWYRIDETGSEVEYFTHTLTDARVSTIQGVSPHVKDPQRQSYTHMEIVHLVYGGITWLFVDGNIEHEDQWHGAR